MARRNSQRLLLRQGIFYFRAAVPLRWRNKIEAREIKLSLQTSSRVLANLRCKYISIYFDLLFSGAVMHEVPLNELHQFARDYLKERLNKALELRLDLPTDPDIDIDLEIQGSVDEINKLKTMLKRHRIEPMIIHEAKEILGRKKSNRIDQDTLTYMSVLVTKAIILQHDYLIQELSGNTYNGAAGDPIFSGVLPDALPEWNAAPKSIDASVSQAIEKYIELKQSTWAKKTQADQKRCLGFAMEVIGTDRSASSIKTSDVQKIRDTLMAVPSNAFKTKSQQGKSIHEIIAEPNNAALLSFKTRDKYFTMIRSFLKWLVDEEILEKMPGLSIKMMGAPQESAIDERDPYTIDELEAIFKSPLYSGAKSQARRSTPGVFFKKDAYFWVPIIALYSGMRLGEIIQLRVSDIRSEQSIYYFDVSLDQETDKSVKTASSIRRVPIHPHLVNLGFLSYVQACKLEKVDRVFSSIRPSIDGSYSANFSKWWSRYASSIQVKSKKITFHSFRHNFVDALRDGEVPEDVSRQLAGHAETNNKSDSHARYGKKTTIKRLYDGISKISYGKIDIILDDACRKCEHY